MNTRPGSRIRYAVTEVGLAALADATIEVQHPNARTRWVLTEKGEAATDGTAHKGCGLGTRR